MSRVYKKPLYRPVPENATIIQGNDGKNYACWNNGNREIKSEIVESKNGRRIVTESEFYIARFTDANGRFRERSTGCRDQRTAEHKLNTWLQEIEKVKSGILSQEEFEISKRISDTIEDQIPHFEEYLKAKSASARYIKMTIDKIKKICKVCNFKVMAEMNGMILLRWLNKQVAAGMGARARNNYREVMVNFSNWAVDNKSLAVNPFTKIPKAREASDRRHERRALSVTEIVRLLKAAEERPLHELTLIRVGTRKGRNEAKVREEVKEQAKRIGWERKLIYATLIYTGLRKNELASITVGQVFLEEEIPYIALAAKDEKSRRGATLPLHPELTEHLRQWLTLKGNGSPKEKLFYVPYNLCHNMTCDLKYAGIEKRDVLNRVVDVHALRHTHATLLAKRGVSPTVAKDSMRHANMRETMGIYTHLEIQDVAEGINRIPGFLNENKKENEK
ncbi:MAG: site-specific integrase [Planctomycetaceae bacterium]|jgi:integrase|nr:site-specific integrase [Planctomycetaceae bacterium]